MACNNHCIIIIRGEPERVPNSRETYGKFAVPMYVCMYSGLQRSYNVSQQSAVRMRLEDGTGLPRWLCI